MPGAPRRAPRWRSPPRASARKLAGQPAPAGERTARVLAGYRRSAGERGRGQARPFGVSDLAAVLATGRGGAGAASSPTRVAAERGRLDAVIAALAVHGWDAAQRGQRAALGRRRRCDRRRRNVRHRSPEQDESGGRGERRWRFVKDGVVRPEPGDRVAPLSAQMIGLRFTADGAAPGIDTRVTAHSGRVGLASELTRRGASTTDVMLAGNWKTSRMVAHYSAGATAERGAVARYL